MIQTKPAITNDPRGALIGFNNLLSASTTSDAEKALIPNTYERWRPPSGAITVKFQMASAAEVDFIGIAAHALSGETFTISTAATIGGATTEVESISPTDNSSIMLNFEPRTVQEIIFTATLVSANEIGIMYAGKALRMPSNIYGGHSPINLSQKTEYQTTISESGQFLGRNITKKGLESSYTWQRLTPDFYRDEFQLFVDSVRTKPFFMLWRPDKFSSESVFGFTASDITPVNSGGGIDLMSVTINVRGHADL